MTTLAIPSPQGDAGDSMRWDRLERVRSLCAQHLRAPDDVIDNGTTLSVVFAPDLTAATVATTYKIRGQVGTTTSGKILRYSEASNVGTRLVALRMT